MDETGPKPPDLEVLPDPAYEVRTVKAIAGGVLAAMAAGLVVFAESFTGNRILP